MENKKSFEERHIRAQKANRLAKISAVVAGVSLLLLVLLNNLDKQQVSFTQFVFILIGIVCITAGVRALLSVKEESENYFIFSQHINGLPESDETLQDLFERNDFKLDNIRKITDIYELAEIYLITKDDNVIIRDLCVLRAMQLKEVNKELPDFKEILQKFDAQK